MIKADFCFRFDIYYFIFYPAVCIEKAMDLVFNSTRTLLLTARVMAAMVGVLAFNCDDPSSNPEIIFYL